ncbi:PREDICTED: ras-related protein Rab-44, partial [Pterocles gutturalis]|uniref:ras-related protein Rab-44 n=1 Tax=Pterocles gutturalis TaxID=240206 RepID=UPI0005283156
MAERRAGTKGRRMGSSRRQFLRSQKAARDHRRRKTASRRVRLVLPSPALEGADSEERRRFAAFMDQLGTDNASDEQEIWELWVKLRQDEPQLLGNPEDFLAKMRHRIQEARSKKEALEVTLNRRVAEHDKEVQQLCGALEQQIRPEQQQLEQESVVRSRQHGAELQRALDASEREMQRLVMAQMELETQCRSLRSTQQTAATENQQLEESNRVLEDRLQHLHRQLQQTHGHLRAARAAAAQGHAEEPGDRAVAELPGEMSLSPSPQDGAEPQTGMERAPAHGTTPRVLPETFSILVGHELFEGDLKEGPEVTQAGASAGAGHRRAQELGTEQGESPEEAQRLLFLQGKGTGGKEQMLKAAEHPQGAAGESVEAGEEVLEVEGEGWMQEKTGWEEAKLSGEAEEAALNQGEKLEAGLGPPEAGEAAGRRLGPAAGAGLEEEADPPSELSEKLEIKPGEHLEPEPPAWGGVPMGAAHGDNVLLEGAGAGQGEGAGAGVQPGEEAGILDMVMDQSTDGHVKPLGELDELKLTPGGSMEADLQLSSEARCPGTEQGGSVSPDVQPLDQVDKPALGEMEAEDAQADMQLLGGASPETPQGGGDCAAVQLKEEAEDGEGPEEHELTDEPVLDAQGAGAGQGEGAGADVQTGEEAGILDVLEEQSRDAHVQLLAEVKELKSAPRGRMGIDLQPLKEAGSLGTEQGGSMAPDVQPLDQADKPALGEMEAEDAQADVQLLGGTSPETPQGKGDGAAVQLEEEAEDGAQGQGEQELPEEPVLDAQGAGAGQGEGAGAGVQPGEEAGILDVAEAQSTDASVQAEELKPPSGGSTEADGTPLGAAGMWVGEQSWAPGSEAGLGAVHTADMWEEAAGVRVSPPPEAALCPEHAAAAKGPGLEAKLGALPGPDGQIPEDTQTLELAQGERDAAEGKPLDGAQGLEVMQGERLEAGARSLVKIQGVGIRQDHDAGASALPTPVSEVPFQISTLELETLMQEDVLVPDVRQLGASGQAAQSQLQEQVSAQGDEGRLHSASRQLEEKLLHMVETEQVAAGSAKPPKQEMPPTSTLRMGVQQEEDAGNDQSGMDVGDSSLGDAANSKMQPQRQLLGEQREDLDVGRWEKKQAAGRKASQQGELRHGEPGAVTAGGAGAAPRGSPVTAGGAGATPRGSPEASPDPDHLYNVLFVGDSHVGKTSFLYRLHADTFNPHLTATVGLDYQIKNLVVDNKRFALRLWDSAGQERYRSITKQFFRKADGVVLMYDITSEYSFSDVRYWLSCIQEGAEDGVAILLLGNKTDCAAARQVPTAEGERLAKEHQLMFYECSAASGHNVCESMVSFIRLLKVREDELKKKAEE